MHTLEALFKSLNERVPQAAVNTLMTDDGTYGVIGLIKAYVYTSSL